MSKMHNGKEYINVTELAEKLMAKELILGNTTQYGPVAPVELDGEAHWDLEAVQKRLDELNLRWLATAE